MALTEPQIRVLHLIASNRSPNSLFAGGAVANRSGPRLSRDLDIEHGSADAVRASFTADSTTLRAAGYAVLETARSHPRTGFIEAVVSHGSDEVLLDWTNDTAVRFFPAVEDEVFGWRLHDVDVALNKLLALAGRRAPRDYYDVTTLHENGFRLGTLAWAAMGKDAGMSPELVLEEASRNSIYPASELLREIDTEEPIDPVALKRAFLAALAEARDEVTAMAATHPETVGQLALTVEGELARLDPTTVDAGRTIFHEPSVCGAWPVIADSPAP